MKLIHVVVETVAGSAIKYHYESASGFFLAKKLLPAGLRFPYDFGFIPGTMGEDGDPLDILLISEFTSYPGTMFRCRVIGCFKALQQEKRSKKKIRNDRLVAIPDISVAYRHITALTQMPQNIIAQLKNFFIWYNQEQGKRFEIKQVCDAAEAMRLITDSFYEH